MADDVKTKSSGRVLAWIALLVFGLPLLYILSIGPAALITSKTNSSTLNNFAVKFYAPVKWLDKNTPLKESLENYMKFWRSLGQ